MEYDDIMSLSKDEIEYIMQDIGDKKYRASQIFFWLHKKNALSFQEMTDIPEKTRRLLSERYSLAMAKIAKKIESNSDGTRKYLFELSNDNIIESVLMKYSYGNSVCVSSQAGCRMGCRFCASSIGGLERNLTASEMLKQVYMIQRDLGENITHVVIMGMGEPLDNFDNVLRFIRLLSSKDGLDISQRRITLSTCGLVDKIRQLAELRMQITLAISLHAPNDTIRKQLMPIAHKVSIQDLLETCAYYSERTKRRITYEYALIDGVNDCPENALELSKKLKGMLCHVNLIPINQFREGSYKKSSSQAVLRFAQVLQKNGIDTTVRRELGGDIEAACGQLRKRFTE